MEGQKYSPKIGFGRNMLELESLYLKKTDLSPCIIPTIDSLHAFFKNYFPKEDIGPFPALYGKYFRNCILPFAGIYFFSEKFICLCMLNALTWSEDFSSHRLSEDESFKALIFK